MRDTTIAARVPLDLRADLERVVELVAKGDPEFTLTKAIRIACREWTDRHLSAAGETSGRLDLMQSFAERAGEQADITPLELQARVQTNGTATSRKAYSDSAPRHGSQRRTALELIAGQPRRGLTTDEVIARMEASGLRVAVNGIARRVTDLKQAGAITPAMTAPGGDIIIPGGTEPVTRLTRNGSHAEVYVVTDKGREWLQEEAVADAA